MKIDFPLICTCKVYSFNPSGRSSFYLVKIAPNITLVEGRDLSIEEEYEEVMISIFRVQNNAVLEKEKETFFFETRACMLLENHFGLHSIRLPKTTFLFQKKLLIHE